MSKKTTTEKEPEQSSSRPSPEATGAQSPAEGAGHQGNQTDAGTQADAVSPVLTSSAPKFALRSDDSVLRDVSDNVVELNEHTATTFASWLSIVRPTDNWRSDPIE